MWKIIALSLPLTVGCLRAQTWSNLGSGTNSAVYSMEVYNGKLYLAGGFTQAGGINTNYIAKWDGNNWSGMIGLNNFMLGDAIHSFNGYLFAGDQGGVKYWNDISWTTYPGVFNSNVWNLNHYNGLLYCGGVFSQMSGKPRNHIARWGGTSWDSVSTGCGGGDVNTFLEFEGKLWVAGKFSTAGSVTASRIATWNDTVWAEVGGGMNNDVYALAIYNGELYAAGRFSKAGTTNVSYIAKWDGSQWVSAGANFNNFIGTLEVFNGQLYAGGYFTGTYNRIARFNGTSWSSLGSGLNDAVNSMGVYNGSLYIGGNFTQAGGSPASKVARWTAPPGPTASFSLSEDTICSGSCVKFTDQSANTPSSWTWNFPGGNPAISTQQSPTVCYNTAGNYSVTLTVANSNGSDRKILKNALIVNVCTGFTHRFQSELYVSLTPNPMIDFTVFKLENFDGNEEFELVIMDMLGKSITLMQFPSGTKQFTVQRNLLPQGFYTWRINFREKSVSGKLSVTD